MTKRAIAGAAAAGGLLVGVLAAAEPIGRYALDNARPQANARVDLPTYPVVASDDGRTLLTSSGEPFLYLADTVWLAPSRLDQDGLRHLVHTRADQGFSTLQVSLLPFVHLPGGLTNAQGSPAVHGTDLAAPVEVGTRTADPNSPDYDYWDHVDLLFRTAAERGMQVTVVPSWYGYGGEDWRGHIDDESARAYGQFLGTRLGGHPNLMWLLGGDNDPVGDVRKVPAGASTGDVVRATRLMGEAIAATEAIPHLMSYHVARGGSSTRYFAAEEWHTFTSAYSGHLPWEVIRESLGSGDPVVLTEAYYDGRERGPVLGRRDLRAQAWWSVLAGAGFAYGHEDVWDLDPGHGPVGDGGAARWQDALHAPSAQDIGVLAATVDDAIPLHPTTEVLVEARGERETLGLAALTSDKRVALVYVPERRWIRVALDALAGDDVGLAWLNPATGAVEDIGVRSSSGYVEVRPPSAYEDAVLILRAR